MPMPTIKITKHKDGRETAWFRDSGGRVRTSLATNWVRADQLRQVADYGITLQVAQARAGIGSNGQPMKPLQGGGHAVFVASRNGKPVFARKTYADWKAAHGLQPVRDLYGPGKGGHMLDEIRINSLDSRRATIAITSKVGRDKARGNELRAAWWGWSPVSARKLAVFAGEVFQGGLNEQLYAMGLIGQNALSQARRVFRRAA